MNAPEEQLHVNAWVFVAIATATTEFSSALSNVMASADFYNHSIPGRPGFEHAIRDLTAAGLINAQPTAFTLTPRGNLVWKNVQKEGPAHRHLEIARAALQTTGCVGDEPGWSIDERAWEDAFAAYSPQFAVELKRRRAKQLNP